MHCFYVVGKGEAPQLQYAMIRSWHVGLLMPMI